MGSISKNLNVNQINKKKTTVKTYFTGKEIQYIIWQGSVFIKIFILIWAREICRGTISRDDVILRDVLDQFTVIDDDLRNHDETKHNEKYDQIEQDEGF